MDVFNVIAGIVTIASLFFSLWVYLDSERKKSVEKERISGVQLILNTLKRSTEAVEKQASLLAVLSDRDDVDKAEIKHLTISMLHTVSFLRNSLAEISKTEDSWEFGVPSNYIQIKTKNSTEYTDESDNHRLG
jgi:hypothetical protein